MQDSDWLDPVLAGDPSLWPQEQRGTAIGPACVRCQPPPVAVAGHVGSCKPTANPFPRVLVKDPHESAELQELWDDPHPEPFCCGKKQFVGTGVLRGDTGPQEREAPSVPLPFRGPLPRGPTCSAWTPVWGRIGASVHSCPGRWGQPPRTSTHCHQDSSPSPLQPLGPHSGDTRLWSDIKEGPSWGRRFASVAGHVLLFSSFTALFSSSFETEMRGFQFLKDSSDELVLVSACAPAAACGAAL